MTDAVADILARVEGLSQHERAELAYALVRSLDRDEDQGVNEAWDAEVARRLSEIQSGSVVGNPAELLFAQLRQPHS